MSFNVDHLRRPWVARVSYLVICHAGWFISVLSAAHRVAWLGMIFSFCVLIYHLRIARDAKAELRLVMATLLGAAGWESAMVAAHVIVYPAGVLIPNTVPYWILGMWMQLAIQVNVLLAWFKRHLWWAAAVGAIAGPLSFRAGVALGAGRFPDATVATIVLAAGWAVLFPAMMALGRRWDGMTG